MFQLLATEIQDRFDTVERFYRACPKKPSDFAQTAKGLVFVQIYAAYEYAVRDATKAAIAMIASQGHAYLDLKPSLLALFLHPELVALRETQPKNEWEVRLKLFEKYVEGGPIPAVAARPHDGTHFKSTQLQMIFRTLGIRKPITHLRRHPQQIDRMVENRNSIAHGDETAAQIGRNYTPEEIRKQIILMKRVCLRLIKVMSEHCSNPDIHCR